MIIKQRYTSHLLAVPVGYGSNAWPGQTVFKLSASGSAYAFRPVPHTTDPLPTAMWRVSPNPAANILTITNGAGEYAATGYTITDMLGRQLLSGPVIGSRSLVSLGDLSAGMYIIELLNNDKSCGKTKFIKQ